MEEPFAELKTRLAEIHDLRRAQEILFWDQTVMMPPGGGSVRGHQVTTLDRIAHQKFISDEIGTLLDDLSGLRAGARLRLGRREPDPHDAPRLGEGESRSRRPRGRDDRRRRRRARRVGEGASRERLRPLPPPPRARGRAEAPLRRVLRRLRRAVRRPPRRLRAGNEDGRGAPGLRRPEGRARAADRRDRLGERRRRLHGRPVAGRRAARLLTEDHRAVRLRPIVRAARPDGASVRRQLGHPGHPPHHALQGRRHHLDLHRDARVRSRPLRARRLAVARAHAALPRRLVGAARVAEPAVGEHRRPQPAFLEPLLPVVPGGVPGSCRRRRPGALLPGDQPRQAVVHPRRRGRGDVQPAHHPPLRAGAGDHGRHDRPEGAAGDLERALRGVPRHPGAERHARRAAGRALVRRQLRLFPDLLAREHRLGADLGEGARARSPTCTTSSSRASSGSCTSGCGATCTSLGRKFTPQETLERVVGGRRSTRPRTCAT